MQCHDIEQLLTSWLLGDLPETEAAKVKQHVEHCDGCRAAIRNIEPTLDLLRAALADPSSAPERLSPAHRQRIENYGIQSESTRTRPRVIQWLTVSHPQYAYAAALLLVGFFVLSALLMPAVSTSRSRASSISQMVGDRELLKGRTGKLEDYLIAGAISDGEPDQSYGVQLEQVEELVEPESPGYDTVSMFSRAPRVASSPAFSEGEGRGWASEKPALPGDARFLSGTERDSGTSRTDTDDDCLGDEGVQPPEPSPQAALAPQPAELDAITVTKSPVVQRGIYGSRSPGARGAAIARLGGLGDGPESGQPEDAQEHESTPSLALPSGAANVERPSGRFKIEPWSLEAWTHVAGVPGGGEGKERSIGQESVADASLSQREPAAAEDISGSANFYWGDVSEAAPAPVVALPKPKPARLLSEKESTAVDRLVEEGTLNRKPYANRLRERRAASGSDSDGDALKNTYEYDAEAPEESGQGDERNAESGGRGGGGRGTKEGAFKDAVGYDLSVQDGGSVSRLSLEENRTGGSKMVTPAAPPPPGSATKPTQPDTSTSLGKDVDLLLRSEKIKRQAYKTHLSDTLTAGDNAMQDGKYDDAKKIYGESLRLVKAVGDRPEDRAQKQQAQEGLQQAAALAGQVDSPDPVEHRADRTDVTTLGYAKVMTVAGGAATVAADSDENGRSFGWREDRRANRNSTREAEGEKDLPLLGDVPTLGRLFRPDGEEEQRKKLEEEQTGPRFRAYGVNPFFTTADQSFSTFSIDVDTAAYTLARNYMRRGYLPPAESVRTEEFVNFFDYQYPAPDAGTFKIYATAAPSPFGRGLQMLKIGVKGRRLGREEQRPAVLTFLIDTSGSMNQPDRLGLVKKSLHLLVGQLAPQDRVAIVQYDSRARLVLEHTPASQKEAIEAAIDSLQCGGSTNLEEGMRRAYELAARSFLSGAENRVLLLSDGVANLGTMAAEDILAGVASFRKQGITCSVFGFGIGTYDDTMLEALANKGDGAYVFIDSEEEARRVMVDDLAATLNTIAADVKIQVEFNPQRVTRYRQLGYENRQLKKEDFRNDAVDAGEVGSGQSVTALYELELKGAGRAQPLATVRVRFRRMDTGVVEEIERAITENDLASSFEAADARFRLAACAAEFAEILRGTPFAAGSEFEDVATRLRPVLLDLPLDHDVRDLLHLIQAAPGMGRGEL